jgi:hypothetical protein
VSYRELPKPTAENCQEVWEKCVAVKAADGTMFHLGGRPLLTKWDDSREDHPVGDHGYSLWMGGIKDGSMAVNHDQAHLLGWTFYEKGEPLVWEGECGTGGERLGFYVPIGKPLPEGFEYKRFHVVATEIVEGEDA